MMKLFRHKGVAKKVLWVIAVIIIISFAGFGAVRYSSPDRSNEIAGKVFGQKITIKEFRAFLLASRDQIMLTYGANSDKIMKYIDLEGETWTRILLVKEAERRGLKVSDREVVAFIRNIKSFHRDGEFDNQLYTSILNHVFHRDAREFEESIRDQIKIGKVIQGSSSGNIKIPEEKIREEYIKRNQKMQVGYVLIDPQLHLTNLTASDADIQAYYDKNQDRFQTSDAINLQYVKIPLSEKSSIEEHDKAKNLADSVYQKASANSDLMAAAKEYNLSVTETGSFSMDNSNLASEWSWDLLAQAFKSKVGTVLPPAVSPAGITIVKILDHQPSFVPTFENAKSKAKEFLLWDKAMDIAKQKATEIRSAIEKASPNGKDAFIKTAKSLGLTPKETPFFAAGDYIPEVGLSEDFHTAAQALTEQKPLSDVILSTKGPIIIWYQATQPIDEKKFEEVKESFAFSLYREESTKVINNVIKDIRARAKVETYLDKMDNKASK